MYTKRTLAHAHTRITFSNMKCTMPVFVEILLLFMFVFITEVNNRIQHHALTTFSSEIESDEFSKNQSVDISLNDSGHVSET